MDIKDPKLKKLYTELGSDLTNEPDPTELKEKYLSKNGALTNALRSISELDPKDRAEYGKQVNLIKAYLEERMEQLRTAGSKMISSHDSPLDVTAPFDINVEDKKSINVRYGVGSKHPLTQELENIIQIYYQMGFEVVESRQLDNDYNMFEALNFPPGHPARDNWDTFWTEEGLIPPAHTSTMQNRVLRSKTPPIRAVIPGRCFRNEATDASHEHTLHQVEGVYVDKGISLGDMIGTIKTYLEAFFETELDVKVQPAFFPFTEPDLEYLISCPFCNKTGCNVCGRSGWMEIMGCGMIHPNVLKEAGIDPNEYSGFAWGFGLDRLVMLKYGIQDIRWLHSGDLNFLCQFRG